MKHTEQYVRNLMSEANLTTLDVQNRLRSYTGLNFTSWEAVNYLRKQTADEIRFIFKFNTM